MIEFISGSCCETQVGSLVPAATFMHNGSIYSKVNTGECGNGVNLKSSSGYSVCYNLKLGSLRQISNNSIVTTVTLKSTCEPTEARLQQK